MSMNADVNKVALPAGEFEKIFQQAHVLTDGLNNAKSARSKATKIGAYLSPYVGREVPINVNGRTGNAKLCLTQGRAKQKMYYFEVRWDAADAATEGSPAEAPVEPDDGQDSPAAEPETDAVDGDGRVPADESGGNSENW